jgi:Flp pilus assembly protein TadD
MYRYAFYLIIAAMLSLSACSSTPSNTAEEVAAPQSGPEAAAAPLNVAEITDPLVALAEGKRLLDENQTEAAIQALERAVELDPDLPEPHFQLGIAYDLLELQQEQAGVITEPASEEADTKRSKNSNSEKNRKKTRSEKSFERAVEAYLKWLDKNPKDDAAHFTLGRTYAKLMKDQEAEKSFREAVKLKPDDAEYQTELGAILVLLAKYHEAIEPLKKALELEPDNVRAEELLEDAQAGRQRIDYAKREANKDQANTALPTRSPGDANKLSREGNSNTSGAPANNVDSRPRTVPARTPLPTATKPPARTSNRP